MKIKPIETVYNGYKFRSRLEAKWAVFFDYMGVKYEYESEGYNLHYNGYYLPDFYLPSAHKGAFLEIKPDKNVDDFIDGNGSRLRLVDKAASIKCTELSMMCGTFVILVFGDPLGHRAVWFLNGNMEYPCAAIDFHLKELFANKYPISPTLYHKQKLYNSWGGHLKQDYKHKENASFARQHRFEHGAKGNS